MPKKKEKPEIEPGIYFDISNEDYHNDPKYNALSAGGIKSLLDSPAHFKQSQANKNPPTPAMQFGSACHSIVLEEEKNEVICEPLDINKRTKEGREQYQNFINDNQGKTIISIDDYQKIKEMKEVLNNSETVKTLLSDGKAEVSGFWKHPVHNFMCKIRPDYLVDDLNLIVDYKTTIDASSSGFGKAAYNFGYHVQAQWYCTGMYHITGKQWDFVFVAQEKTPPYAVGIYSANQLFLKDGEKEIRKAVLQYAECLKTNEWPGYPDTIQPINRPGWAGR